jgi:hypothetical protein
VGDYSYTQLVSREDALKDIALATEIVTAIEKHLSPTPASSGPTINTAAP